MVKRINTTGMGLHKLLDRHREVLLELARQAVMARPVKSQVQNANILMAECERHRWHDLEGGRNDRPMLFAMILWYRVP